jgi:hypothetical protein
VDAFERDLQPVTLERVGVVAPVEVVVDELERSLGMVPVEPNGLN